MKKLFTDKKWKPWTPCFIITAIGLIMYIATVCVHGFNLQHFAQIFSGMAAVYLIPIFGLIVKRHFSVSITYGLGIILVFALFAERLFDIYNWFPGYDKVMHTIFGIVGAAIIFALVLRWTNGKIAPLPMMMVVIIGTLGFGAVWEMFEYITSVFSTDDPQKYMEIVNASIEAGEIVGNPVQDTMEDLIVTVIGSIGFCIAYIIDLWASGGSFFLRIFGEGDLNSDPLPLETAVNDTVEPLAVAGVAAVSGGANVEDISSAETIEEFASEGALDETEASDDERFFEDGSSGPGENRS